MQPERQTDRLHVFFIVLIAVLCVSAGETLLAAGMKQVGDHGGLSMYLRAAANPLVILGTLLMMGFFALYQLALAKADLSYVLPLTGLSFVFGALFAHVFLGEHISPARWLGTLLIVLGVVIVGLGSHGESR